MGTTLSMAKNNDDLIENLINSRYLQTKEIIQGFRNVDRGDFVSPSRREAAYADCAWKYKDIHLSAPSIYSFALEALQIDRGMCFLNIGSGSGYLNTIVGLLVGEYGVNHGIELHKDVIIHAEVCIESFVTNILPKLKNASFCRPVFTHGNALTIVPNMLYDRIYIGAKCSEAMSNYFKKFLKVDGCLILPISNCLCLIQRISSRLYHWSAVTGVSFASLVSKNQKEVAPDRDLETLGQPSTLREICKRCIRDLIEKEALVRITEKQNLSQPNEKEDNKEKPTLRSFLFNKPFPVPEFDINAKSPVNKPENQNKLNSPLRDIETVKRDHMNNCPTCTNYAVQDNRASDSDDDDPNETFEQLELDIGRFRDRFQWVLEAMRNRVQRRHRARNNHTENNDISNDDVQNDDSDSDGMIDSDIEERNKSTPISKTNENVTETTKDTASCSHDEKGPKRPSEFEDESESKRLGTSQNSNFEGDMDVQDDPNLWSLSSSQSSSSSFSSIIMGPSTTNTTDSMDSINSYANEKFVQHLQLDSNDIYSSGDNFYASFANSQKKEQTSNVLEPDLSRDVDRFIQIFNEIVDELPLPELIKKYIKIKLLM